MMVALTPTSTETTRLPVTLRSLRIRNYRLWFTGQVISVAGTWTQTVAQAILVLHLSHDNGIAAGASVALQYLPTLIFGTWGGLLADRFDKRRILMITQSLLAFFALGLAALDASGSVSLIAVFALITCSGCVTAVDQPARQSFVTELVGPEDLPNAIGLNSTVFNSARMIGPAIAAGVIYVSGTAGCFLLNAISYLAILIGLTRMRTDELHRAKRLAKAKGQVREGIRYAWSQPQLRANLLLMTMVGTFAFNFTIVLPLIAKVTFHGGAGTISTVFICQGGGALVGALTVASLKRTDGRRLLASTLVLGIAMFAASLAPSLPVLLAVLPIMGLAGIFTASSSNSMVQLDADPSMRGRVTSLRTLTVLGSTPIGGMIVGTVARFSNPRWALAVGGIGCLLGAVVGRDLAHDVRR